MCTSAEGSENQTLNDFTPPSGASALYCILTLSYSIDEVAYPILSLCDPPMSSNSSWAPNETAGQIFAEKTWLQGALLTGAAYGVVFTLFVMNAQLLWMHIKRDAGRRRGNIVLLVYVTAMFICGTLFMASMSEMTQLSFIEDRNYPGGPAAYEEDMFSIPVDDLGNVVFTIANWLADALLVWRCMVIYRAFGVAVWISMFIPCLTFLASFIIGVLFLQQITAPGSSPWAASGVNMTLPSFALSLALNIALTLMIIVRLLAFRLRVGSALGKQHTRTYTSVAALLIESASLYAIFNLLFLVPFVVNHPIQNVFIQVLSQVQIIAPFLIIYRVASGKAWSDATPTSLKPTGTNLHFETQPTTNVSDTSAVDTDASALELRDKAMERSDVEAHGLAVLSS